jgi:hypothetical protein
MKMEKVPKTKAEYRKLLKVTMENNPVVVIYSLELLNLIKDETGRNSTLIKDAFKLFKESMSDEAWNNLMAKIKKYEIPKGPLFDPCKGIEDPLMYQACRMRFGDGFG